MNETDRMKPNRWNGIAYYHAISTLSQRDLQRLAWIARFVEREATDYSRLKQMRTRGRIPHSTEKTLRNSLIYRDREGGKTFVQIAKEHGISTASVSHVYYKERRNRERAERRKALRTGPDERG